MFWSGNYIAVRELNFLLKEENVSLSQVLEADDILQECKADNKALTQFLTRPEILAELITLITEEPPKNVELTSQYRHASIACEVLTSQLSTLSDRLSLDTVQMNRLCDFINKEPPLNPLLASYFSKTVEMLLERSPKQDWYLYHIVCLRVLDFFKSRRDFLPNLLRHMHTSAIADTFKYFIRLDDLFNKIVMEWLDEHQFLECLIQIICGTYEPEPIRPASEVIASPTSTPTAGSTPNDNKDQLEKADSESNEKPEVNQNHKAGAEALAEKATVTNSTSEAVAANGQGCAGAGGEHALCADYSGRQRQEENHSEGYRYGAEGEWDGEEGERSSEGRGERMKNVAAANAAALLCDLILNGCAPDGCTTRARTVWAVVWRLQSERWVKALLAAVFTSPPARRAAALVHAAQTLLALLSADPAPCGGNSERSSVELCIAPHLPLLHQALLHPPPPSGARGPQTPPSPSGPPQPQQESPGETRVSGGGGGGGGAACVGVGAARVHVCALLAHLAHSESEDVCSTLITLGTPGVLVDLFLAHPDNNFLHAQVYAFIRHALANPVYHLQYARHLLLECDLLTRFMDVFEQNENKPRGVPRAGYMGHVILTLRRVAQALGEAEAEGAGAGAEGEGGLRRALRLPLALLARWDAFVAGPLTQRALQHETPLGGYYPVDNIYESDHMPDLADGVEATYEFNEGFQVGVGGWGDGAGAGDGDGGCNLQQWADAYLNKMGLLLSENDAMEIGPCEMGEGEELDRDGFGGVCGEGREDKVSMLGAKNAFLELASQRFDDDLWEDAPSLEDELGAEAGAGAGGCGRSPPAHDVQDVLTAVAPWEMESEGAFPTSGVADGGGGGGGGGGEDWAQFGAAAPPPPVDPYAPVLGTGTAFTAFWTPAASSPSVNEEGGHESNSGDLRAVEEGMQNLHLYSPGGGGAGGGGCAGPGSSSAHAEESAAALADNLLSDTLANNLLSAMSGMTPDLIANIVNANMPDQLPANVQHEQNPDISPLRKLTEATAISELNFQDSAQAIDHAPNTNAEIDSNQKIDSPNIDTTSKSSDTEPSTRTESDDKPSSDNSSSIAAAEPSSSDSADTYASTESEPASDS